MSTYVISIEGQSIPVPEEIGASDENVRAALAPFYPAAAGAMITRVEKDDVVTVNVIKKAGPHGLAPLAALVACQGGENPAIALYKRLQQAQGGLSVEEILTLDAQIDQAVVEGERQAKALEAALRRLASARSLPAPVVPLGF